MTEYEVKCPQTWAWYTGYVHDYNEGEKKLYIKYGEDWKSPEWIDVTSVRYKYDSCNASSLMKSGDWRPSYNEEVECKARAEEREPYGWWPCKAQPYKEGGDGDNNNNNLYSVAFIGWGNEHNEILGIEFIRKKSSAAVLSDKNMYREVYSVPVELKDWVLTHCANNTILETLMPHKNISSQIIHIWYLESSNKLLLIGVKRVLLTMKDIIFCFFEKQKSLLKLEKKTNELEAKSKLKKEEELKAEKYTFNVHPLLSGYLRGKKGTNIDQVKRRNNKIIRIEPQNGSCYIAAKDKRSLNAAIDSLHVVCKKVIIPKHEMGQIIGSHGQQIQDIKRKSQVIKVISWKLWPKEFNTLREIQTKRYKSPSYQIQQQLQKEKAETEGADEEEDNEESNIPDIIKNATLDNIFGEDDVVDLSTTSGDGDIAIDGEESNTNDDENALFPSVSPVSPQQKAYEKEMDALVIIGRKSRVALCIFMIEMTLTHFRQITKTRNNVRALRQKINQIKGNPIIPYNRRRYQQQNSERTREQKDNSPQRDRDRDRDRRGPRNRYQQQRYQRREREREAQQYDEHYDNYRDREQQSQNQNQNEQETTTQQDAAEAEQEPQQSNIINNHRTDRRNKRNRTRKKRSRNNNLNKTETPQ